METTTKVTPLFRSEVICLKGPNVTAVVDSPNRYYYLVQPTVDYADRLGRIEELSGPTGLSASQFEDLAMDMLKKIRDDKHLALAAAGVCLPIPFGVRKIGDYGTDMEALLVSVGNAYENEFPQRRFTNRRKGTLTGQVTVLPNTRHDRLIVRLSEPGVGLYFPNLMQGFSVEAQRQKVGDLPESMLLCGAIDTALAMTIYPDVLARDLNTPGLDCSAVRWQSVDRQLERSLCFKAYGDELQFGREAEFSRTNGFYSGGLLFLG